MLFKENELKTQVLSVFFSHHLCQLKAQIIVKLVLNSQKILDAVFNIEVYRTSSKLPIYFIFFLNFPFKSNIKKQLVE